MDKTKLMATQMNSNEHLTLANKLAIDGLDQSEAI